MNYTPVLRGCEIPSQHIASVIDEIPVLALVAAHARGITVFHEVGELRVKESDRLQAIIDGLALLGVDAWEEGDDLFATRSCRCPRASSSSPTATTAWP